ncbi:glutamyl-tRNA(Gln) amidotransferase subunit B, mitochondrial [Cryptococcus sp. DSM 104549]
MIAFVSRARLRPTAYYRACTPRAFASQADASTDWHTVIGLEIHAQLKTGKKLFSEASTSYGHVPNTNVDPQDAAFPGTLPVLDLNAIRLSLETALALGCRINPRSTFDRKHYFYHDIPASYQITQHYNPLARDGHLQIKEGDNHSPRTFNVGIKQLQVEQDTAKSQSVGSAVLVDLNRAGTGLMEIVTEPDMRSPEEAGAFVKKLQGLLRRVGSADGDMEKGNLRVDVNVSVHKPGTPFGTRCEIKNINSVRFLQAAIESERRRHIAHYLSTPSLPIAQETRGFNELTLETYSLRSKEEATDYRYMPDSNLPAMAIDPTYLAEMADNLPKMPWHEVDILVDSFGMTKRDAETIVALDEYSNAGFVYFQEVVGGEADAKFAKRAMSFIIHEKLGHLNKIGRDWTPEVIRPKLMRDIINAVDGRGAVKITGTTGKALIKHLVNLPPPPPDAPTPTSAPTLDALLNELGLAPGPGAAQDISELCEQAMVNVPKAVADYKKGNKKVVMRLVGEVMKLSGGTADAQEAKEVLSKLLDA